MIDGVLTMAVTMLAFLALLLVASGLVHGYLFLLRRWRRRWIRKQLRLCEQEHRFDAGYDWISERGIH